MLWNGLSNSKPAAMSTVKEDFVRELLQSAAPGVKSDDVVRYMKRVSRTSYPDGSTTMPRAPLGGIKMVSVTSGTMFMVVLAK